jgi:hypothetical protein
MEEPQKIIKALGERDRLAALDGASERPWADIVNLCQEVVGDPGGCQGPIHVFYLAIEDLARDGYIERRGNPETSFTEIRLSTPLL